MAPSQIKEMEIPKASRGVAVKDEVTKKGVGLGLMWRSICQASAGDSEWSRAHAWPHLASTSGQSQIATWTVILFIANGHSGNIETLDAI